MMRPFFASMELLKELIALGFSPFLCLVLVVVVVLWGSLLWLLAFFWRFYRNQEKAREVDREERYEEISKKLQECEDDRGELRTDVTELKIEVAKWSTCPKRDCPKRLP